MKIVDRKTFLSMPENTLFMKYVPCCFSDPCIKMRTIEDDDNRCIDFFYQPLNDVMCPKSGKGWPNEYLHDSDVLLDAQEQDKSFLMDYEVESRDGEFQQKQLFAVYDSDDINLLINRLARCL